MNVFVGVGRLTRDVETGSTQSGGTYARFGIAVPRKFKREGEPDADFFNCSAFGKTADFIGRYFSKGKMIALQGRIQNHEYTNKDGVTVKTDVVMVENCDFAESKSASQQNQSQEQSAQQTQSQPQSQAAPQSQQKPDMGFMEIPNGIEETLPFS